MTTDIHQIYRELTQPHTTTTPYIEERTNGEHWTRNHTIQMPPLLEQLAHATPAATDAATNGSFESALPERMLSERLDALIAIEQEAAYLLRMIGANDDGHALTVVKRLYALRSSLREDSPTRTEIDAHGHRWWHQTRILTGHDTSAFRPNNTCPLCATRGTLRIRRDATAGVCIKCRETWMPETIGLLAEHIRTENQEQAS